MRIKGYHEAEDGYDMYAHLIIEQSKPVVSLEVDLNSCVKSATERIFDAIVINARNAAGAMLCVEFVLIRRATSSFTTRSDRNPMRGVWHFSKTVT